MHKIIGFILLAWCLMIPAWPASAQPAAEANPNYQNSSILISLKQLCDKGAYQQAYQLAQSALGQWEGDPEFDFYYGLAALETNHLPESQFVYERLVSAFPQQQRYRLEYGRSLFLLAQYDAAAQQFQQVLEQQPPQAVSDNIERYVKAIKQRQRAASNHWQGHVSIGGGYDSNINNATALAIYDNSILSDSARKIESSYFSAQSQLNFLQPITQQQSLHFGVDSSHKLNSKLDDFNIDTLGLKTYWQNKTKAQTLKLGLRYLELLLSGSRYKQDSTLYLEWQKQWSPGLISQSFIGLTQKNYSDNADYESTQPLASWTVLLPHKKWLQAYSVFVGTDQARNNGIDLNMRDFGGLSYRLNYQPNSYLTLFLSGSAFWSKYQDIHPVFLQTRRDNGFQVSTGFAWQWTKHWWLKGNMSYTENQSSLVLYEYDRIKNELKLQWQF